MDDRGNVETTLEKPNNDEALLSLSLPFEALTLRRPMKLFPTSLGLKLGVSGLPSEEFLAILICGRRTYLAAVRALFGSDFKNFQNYARQRVQTTPETCQRLLGAVGGDAELLEALRVAIQRDPKARDLAVITRAAEGVASRVMQQLLAGSLKCPHCRGELISRPARWWRDQICVLGETERRFVDRILHGLMLVALVPLIGSSWSRKEQEVSHLAALCKPGGHPFKHWLDRARAEWRAKDLTALAARSGLTGRSAAETLQRCARGEMLTVEVIEEVTARLRTHKQTLRSTGMQARALAFVVDFMIAADSSQEPLSTDAAQAIVSARIVQLYQDLRLTFAREAQHQPDVVTDHSP